jgi:predicted RNase H-like nuclease (RuvC/YqgF family)
MENKEQKPEWIDPITGKPFPQAPTEKEESFSFDAVKALMEIARKSRDPEISKLQSELSSLKAENKELKAWLEAYKESNARLVAKLGNYAARIDDVSGELKSRIEELSKDKTS